uniref:Ig-like domain-containing protein n=1 Tax=Nothobranchius furzeri TaxID=105023 RepID=A0A8C6NPG1_NOTFU
MGSASGLEVGTRWSRSPGRSPARRLDDTDEIHLERLYKPVFVMKPSSIKCSEGQTARFDLKVVGRPMPDTYWFHDGKRIISEGILFIVIKEDGTQSLIIVPAVPKDSGEWTVVAQNRAGRTSVSVALSVEGMFCGETEEHHSEAGNFGGVGCQSHWKPPTRHSLAEEQ